MTELELTILAIIARDGPVSAYQVRKVFEQSPTPSWSSSAGSIYPAIRRLMAAKVVTAAPPRGSRKRQDLRITGSGGAVVRDWLSAISVANAGASPDPVRTRFFFLELLEREHQIRLVAQAMLSTQEAIAIVRKRQEGLSAQGVNELQQMATEGVLFELRARLAWLTRLGARLDRDETSKASALAPASRGAGSTGPSNGRAGTDPGPVR